MSHNATIGNVRPTPGAVLQCAAPAHPLSARYFSVREATMALATGLSAEDCALQSMPDASPVKWHLAHTSWFFETFVLEQAFAGYKNFHPQFRVLFNSYYVGVGERHPRAERGLLSRPTFEDIVHYRQYVDAHMEMMMDDVRAQPQDLLDLIELGLHHEQQHQELILTDLKHLLSRNPLKPHYQSAPFPMARTVATELRWMPYSEGLCMLGHGGEGFSFDNELPRHRVFLEAHALASRFVTNEEYQDFIDDSGYTRPELWLSEGWDVMQTQGWNAPLYWEKHQAGWRVFTLAGMQIPDPAEPVYHVSYFEANAYARWAGARLPYETEWESAAAQTTIAGNFVEDGMLRPLAAPRQDTPGPQQLYGDLWEWTQSAYAPYPGYHAPPGAVGEYNGKFIVNQYVLRGGSFATPRSHIRTSYRNFFPAATRWQFAGIRLARDGLQGDSPISLRGHAARIKKSQVE